MPQTIARGAIGPAVRELQHNLRRHGAQLKPDSVFGPATEHAVRAFQSSAHLPSDGIVGARTWNALHGIGDAKRNSPERPIQHDWSFEKMLKDVGAWVEDHNPFGGSSAPTPPPARSTPASAKAGAAPAHAPAAKHAPSVVNRSDGSRTSRIGFAGYEGRGWIIRNFADMRGKQVREFRTGKFAVNPVGGKPIFGINECVHLVKYFGVPYTGLWRRGPQVCTFKPGELPVGTVIATLRDDVYHSDYSGRSHVGIYLGHDDYGAYQGSHSKTAGVLMCNQWNGKTVQDTRRPYAVDAGAYGGHSKKPWIRNGKETSDRLSWMNDGEEYFVVMTN